MDLDNLRKKIDSLDSEIIRLLNERIEIVQQIGNAKKESGAEIYVPSRERAVFEKIKGLNKGPLPEESAHAIYREIMSAALALETNPSIVSRNTRIIIADNAPRDARKVPTSLPVRTDNIRIIPINQRNSITT